MTYHKFSLIKRYFTLGVAITAWLVLIYQHFNGGVSSHYLLNRSDMPSISNWWGAILLPVLSWGLLSVVAKFERNLSGEINFPPIFIHFIIAFIYGTLLSQLFTLGYPQISSILFPSILLFAIFFKVYKAEFILGFILSMSVVFGAALPTLFGFLIAFISFLVHQTFQFLWQKAKAMKQVNQTF